MGSDRIEPARLTSAAEVERRQRSFIRQKDDRISR